MLAWYAGTYQEVCSPISFFGKGGYPGEAVGAVGVGIGIERGGGQGDLWKGF